MERWIWIKILNTNSFNLQIFLKAWPQLRHGKISHRNSEVKRAQIRILFLLPSSKPYKEKFQQIHCKFILLFHSNRILVFPMKILLSNINKPDTVKLLIVHKSVLLLHSLFGIFLSEAALLVITLVILFGKKEKYCENNLPLSYQHTWNLLVAETPLAQLSLECLLNRGAAETGWLGKQ